MRRCLLVLVVVTGLWLGSPTPAAACSCIGDLIQAHEQMPFEIVFVGRVVDSGVSNVTAEWSDPPLPGLALRFEVDTVRVGEVGSHVVVHTPGGGAGGGNCAIGVVSGSQLVVGTRDDQGYLRGGLCSIVPLRIAPTALSMDEGFGPEREPDPAIPAEPLDAGVARPPDPEDAGSVAVYEALDGELDFSTTTTIVTSPDADTDAALAENGEEEGSDSRPWFLYVSLGLGCVALVVVSWKALRGA